MSLNRPTILAMLTMVFLLCAGRIVLAQSTASHPMNTSNQPQTSSIPATQALPPEDSWRNQPVDLKAQQDSAPPSLRQIRSSSWKHVFEYRLTQEKKGATYAMSNEDSMAKDISTDPQSVWIVAKFDSFTIVPTDPDDLTMYTELHFSTERVIRQPKSQSLTSNSQVDVDIAGGRIKTEAGDVKSFSVAPHEYFVQPGKTYLMNVKYLSQCSCFLLGHFWRVENGMVVSGYREHSALTGRTIEDAIFQIKAVNPEK